MYFFSYGSGYSHDYKSVARYVRAVRGGQAGSLGHLVINDDGTVMDAQTGLMWRRTTDKAMPWSQALTHCETMTAAGYDDWRLPTIKELASITALDRYYPAIDTDYFPNTASSGYWWSSSPYALNASYAWNVYFFNGDGSYDDYQSVARYVRAVRGGQNQISGHLVITTPRQASFWNVESTLPITWDTAGISGDVKISISYEGGRPGTFKTIAASTPNDGAYDWTIAATPSPNCMLKIEPLSDPSKGTVQGLFTILYYLYATPSSFGLVEPATSGGTAESKIFTVVLTADPGGDIELELAASNPGECAVSPTSITLNSTNWNTGIKITVTPEYDGVADGDQVTSILASAVDSPGPFQAKDFPLVQVIVRDSDTNTAIHSVSPAYGEARRSRTVTMEGFNFTTFTKVYILPDGGTATQITPVTFLNETALSFTIPGQTAGGYTLRAGSFDLKSAVAFTDSSTIAAQNRKKAIIVAGSGPFYDNGFWLATAKCTAHAWRTLAFLGYPTASIQYLNAALYKDLDGDGENDVDANATSATLQAAIASLDATNTDELLLYMIGPGGDGTFQFGSNAEPEYLNAATLDSWLDDLQSRITGQVIVIHDAPYADTFLSALQAPSDKKRLVISSISPGERAWFLDDGELSFSYRFFSHLLDNAELFQAIDDAKTDVQKFQTPIIDINSDGLPDPQPDSEYTVGRGRFVDNDPPSIGTANASPNPLNGSASSTLSASSVQAGSGLSRIWARIIPPIDDRSSLTDPVLTVASVKLLDVDQDGVYDYTYEEFSPEGDYTVFIHAVDRMGAVSFPKFVEVLSAYPGDVNLDNDVDLRDAIFTLQAMSGMEKYPSRAADATNDEKIGMDDAVYILRSVSGL